MDPDPPSSLIGLLLSLIIGTLLGDLESLNLGSRGPGLGDLGPELMRLRSARRDGEGDLDLGGDPPPSSGPQQAASGGVCAIGENSSLGYLSLPSPSPSSSFLAFAMLRTGDNERRPLFVDLLASSNIGLALLGTPTCSLSSHP